VDFDSGGGIQLLTSDAHDAFLSKLSPGGDYVWATNLGGSGNEEGDALRFDDTGSLYLCGNFTGSFDCDPGTGITMIASHGASDIFIEKFSASVGLDELFSGTAHKECTGIYDLSGRVCAPRNNALLIYRYSDGSVEKVFISE
jgi:hypothetical protein